MLGHLFLVVRSLYASRAGMVLEFMLWFLYLRWGCVFLCCCVVESSAPWPFLMLGGVFLDAEGAFLYAWAVCRNYRYILTVHTLNRSLRP